MLEVKRRIGIPETKTSGSDSLNECLNKNHYNAYTKNISYRYNSRGFRDDEWPTNLSDVIWCVGDSFTTGIGQPFEETWPQVLQKETGKRCLNIGVDGSSNDSIAIRAKEICLNYNPKIMVIMWSYFHRRKDSHHDRNDFTRKKDLSNFIKNFKAVNSIATNVVNLLIPKAFLGSKPAFSEATMQDHKITEMILNKKGIKNVFTFQQLDYARDYHHFDIQTSKSVCDIIQKRINQFDKTSK